MSDRDTLLEQIADHVTQLVDPRQHREPYRYQIPGTRRVRWYGHVTQQPSLLDQLRAGGAAAAEETEGTRSFESVPPNAFDCFTKRLTIEAGSAWWVSVAWRMPLRESVEGNLRAMAGKASDPSLRDVDFDELAADLRVWHSWASVLTGWTVPPFRPRASCPVCCSKRGTLRIRPDERTGACMQCGSAWDTTTFGILVDHIRSEGEQADTPNEVGVVG